MAKPPFTIALCLLSCFVFAALGDNNYNVQGRVYCDTCRAGFETTATEYIERLRQRQADKDGGRAADKDGIYSIVVKDVADHNICEAVLVESPREDCNQIKADSIVLNHENGMSSDVRTPNSLGFFINNPLPVCGLMLQEYDQSDNLDS